MSRQPKKYQQNQNESDYYNIVSQQVDSQAFNELPVQESQSEDEQILDKIDSLLRENQTHYLDHDGQQNPNPNSKREMLLNFKISELQKIVQNLTIANKMLNHQLSHHINQKEQKNQLSTRMLNNQSKLQQNPNKANDVLNNSSDQGQMFNDQLTEMQGEVQEIQSLIKEYKDQLAASETKWIAIVQDKDEEIDSLKRQILLVTQNYELLQNEQLISSQQIEAYTKQIQNYLQQTNKFTNEVEMLKSKNQQLLLQIQNLESQLQRRTQILPRYNNSPTSPRRVNNYFESGKKFQAFQDYSFNQKIQHEMETMIKKLMKQLSNQKKVNAKINLEIKRLNNQIIEMEKQMKIKNDSIYQLQMKTIQLQKVYPTAYHTLTHQTNPNPFYNSNSPYNSNLQFNSNLTYNPNIHFTSNPVYNPNPIYNLNHITNSPNHRQINHTPINYKNDRHLYQQNRQSRGPLHYNKKIEQEYIKEYSHRQYTNLAEENDFKNYEDSVSSVPFVGLKNKDRQLHGTILNKDTINESLEQQLKNLPRKMFKQKIAFQEQENVQRIKKPSGRREFLSFTLMQLQEQKLKVTMKQKIIIISRLIDLYCKKIKAKNYYNLIAEQILVYNFNEKHPNLIRVKVLDGISNTDEKKNDMSNSNNNTVREDISSVQDESEESLMYNLAFIVESLVKQVQTVDRPDLQININLSEIIDEILAKSIEEKLDYFHELSKSLENSVKALN